MSKRASNHNPVGLVVNGPQRKADECRHPARRLYAWAARDDSAKPSRLFPQGGRVLCVACCECGAVLQGGAE